MPDNLLDWIVASFMLAGSFGGIMYLIQRMMDMMTRKDKYDPWEPEIRTTTLPARIEPPISARRK